MLKSQNSNLLSNTAVMLTDYSEPTTVKLHLKHRLNDRSWVSGYQLALSSTNSLVVAKLISYIVGWLLVKQNEII